MSTALKNLALLLVSAVVGLLALEGAVRLVFAVDDRPRIVDPLLLQPHFVKGVGSVRQANSGIRTQDTCLAVDDVRYNANGLRVTVGEDDRPTRIGVLGDSYMEARMIEEGQTAASLLANLFDTGVRNAGISGASTLKQTLLHDAFIKTHSPSLVLKFAYPANDILESNCDFIDHLGRMVNKKPNRACAIKQDRGYSIREAQPIKPDPSRQTERKSSWSQTIKANCHSCRAIYEALKGLGLVTLNDDFDLHMNTRGWLRLEANSLSPARREVTQAALAIVSRAVEDLDRGIGQSGGQLYVVLVPSHLEYSPVWETEFHGMFGIKAPAAYDPHRPTELMRQILRELDIPTIDVISVFDAYIAQHNLPFPWLSFRCDAHWNPIGHFLAASVVAQRLVEDGVFDVQGREAFIAARLAERDQSPKEILGDRAYAQIYEGGFYEPGQP